MNSDLEDLSSVFSFFRDIPYRIPLSSIDSDDSCVGKNEKLKKKLEKLGFSVRWRVCTFRWETLALPKEIAHIPHDEVSTHAYLEVLIENEWKKIDATWDADLQQIFPIPEWDGRSETILAVTPIEIFDPEKSEAIIYSPDADESKQELERNREFYEALNEFFEEERPKEPFFVRFLVPTNSSIAMDKKEIFNDPKPGWHFKFPDVELAVYDSEQGLLADVLVEEHSLDSAINSARNSVENLSAVFTFLSGNPTEPVRFLFGYNFSENRLIRQFRQEFLLPISNERRYEPLKTALVHEIFNAVSETLHSQEIVRSLVFFRASMRDGLNDTVRFFNLWQGLEVLNEKLMDYYQMTAEERLKKCKECNVEVGLKDSGGIEKLFDDNEQFHDVRRFRGKFVHAKGKFDQKYIEDCLYYSEVLREKLIKALVLLLKLPEETEEKLLKAKRRPMNPYIRMVVRAGLSGFKPSKLSNSAQHPHFFIRGQNISVSGSLNKEAQSKLELVLTGDAMCSVHETNHFSYDGSENVVKEMKAAIS